MSHAVRYKGSAEFRTRVVCSLLSGRVLRVDEIRAKSEKPGLHAFEASFLRLIDSVTNGTKIEINETGTKLRFVPGIIVGGKVTHACGTARAVSYFLEPLILLAPFSKKPFSVTLTGITNGPLDPSVDTIQAVTMPMLKYFGITEGTSFKIKSRGAPPLGGGEVHFQCLPVRQLKPINFCEEGLIKRVRGTAYTTKVSPHVSNRMRQSARALLNKFIPDVHIYTNHFTGKEGGLSPGFGLSMIAESTSGAVFCAEAVAAKGALPEDLGKEVSELLCEEIARGGCVDSVHQSMVVTFMALGPEDVSRVRFGKLAPRTIETLRTIRDFLGLMFRIKPDPETKTTVLSCLGAGFKNVAKKVS